MDERRDLRKFSRGERCHECGARKWYLENGLRFCSNGHQVEGFVQFEVGNEDDAGKHGAAVRREKDIKERELRHLGGQAGKNLYLECLQLVMRNQLRWLINTKGYREELETVVRDLWDLRTRGSGFLAPEDDAPDEKLEMFSSQPEAKEQTTSANKHTRRAQSWDPERGPDWPMPRMLDTLVLFYLACLLLRIPTRIGEVCRWVNDGHISYKRAYYDLPQEMQDRLPSAYTRALKLPLRARLKGSDLQSAVLDMALSYYRNYEMVFPAMSVTAMAVQYARHLALPIEVLVVARRAMAVMNMDFQLPIRKSRVFIIDHPETLLVASIIVATKLCLPFANDYPLVQITDMRQNFRFSWDDWREYIKEPVVESQAIDDESMFDKVAADEIISMTPEQLDAYFAHIASTIDKKNNNAITGFFPSENAPVLQPPRPEVTEKELDNKLIRSLARSVKPYEDEGLDPENAAQNGSNATYEAFRVVEDLSEVARLFYEAAGTVAGLSLQETVRAVYMLEQRILAWQLKRKPIDEEFDDDDDDDE
ncbi:hypothetical protein G7046_g3386 [Stylonectria norvegica]|nr:hypothetical protein G7046_g3386 [Stylonectria norvegica]